MNHQGQSAGLVFVIRDRDKMWGLDSYNGMKRVREQFSQRTKRQTALVVLKTREDIAKVGKQIETVMERLTQVPAG